MRRYFATGRTIDEAPSASLSNIEEARFMAIARAKHYGAAALWSFDTDTATGRAIGAAVLVESFTRESARFRFEQA